MLRTGQAKQQDPGGRMEIGDWRLLEMGNERWDESRRAGWIMDVYQR